MKSALSLTLIVCLVGSVAAQEQTERAGPLARAITIEAGRLAAASETTSSSVDAVQTGGKPAAESNWSRVRRLRAGTKILVTAVNRPAEPQEVLAVDDAALTIVNRRGLESSPRAAVLRRIVSEDPEGIAAAGRGGSLIGNKVRIAPDGVFIDGQKIMELRQLLERIPREDILQIVGPVRIGSPVGAAGGALLGVFAAFPGVVAGALSSRTKEVAAFVGLPIAFGALGYYEYASTKQAIIYRRP